MNITIPKHVEITNNGIIFYSNRKPREFIHAYIEGKEIKLEKNLFSSEQTKNKVFFKLSIAIAFMFFAFVFQKRSSFNITGASVMFLLCCYGNFFHLCEEFFYTHISKKKRRHQKIYTSKIMLFNTYKKLNGIPNLWEINNKFDDELHEKIILTLRNLLFSVSFIFYTYKNIFQFLEFYFLSTIITSTVAQLLGKTRIHLQWLFFSEPTNLELQCVLDGFCKWIQSESEIEDEEEIQ